MSGFLMISLSFLKKPLLVSGEFELDLQDTYINVSH